MTFRATRSRSESEPLLETVLLALPVHHETASQGEAGFTLVELLVSLALLALMMTYAVFGLLDLAANEPHHRSGRGQDEADAARAYLAQEIADLRVLFEAEDDGSQTLVFDGEPHALRYIASSDGARETGGLYQASALRN